MKFLFSLLGLVLFVSCTSLHPSQSFARLPPLKDFELERMPEIGNLYYKSGKSGGYCLPFQNTNFRCNTRSIIVDIQDIEFTLYFDNNNPYIVYAISCEDPKFEINNYHVGDTLTEIKPLKLPCYMYPNKNIHVLSNNWYALYENNQVIICIVSQQDLPILNE